MTNKLSKQAISSNKPLKKAPGFKDRVGASPLSFGDMLSKYRFTAKEGYAAISFGAPANTISIEYSMFKKTLEEKDILAKTKKEHNKKLFKLFGTKRPTAGIVARHSSLTN